MDGVMASLGLAVAVVFAVSWTFGRMNLSGLTLIYRSPGRVEAGKGFEGKLSLSNGGRALDGFWIDFRMSVCGERFVGGRASWIGDWDGAEVSERIVLQKRSLALSHAGRLRSAFPLGLMVFTREVETRAEIGVLPRPVVPRELRLSGYLMDGTPMGGASRFGGIGEWRGLRERRGGDGMRRIAWAASVRSEAAGGALLVREDEPPGFQAESCLVVFHSHGGDGNLIRPDRFENALSLLYGSLISLHGCGMPVRWIADFNEWEEGEVRTAQQLAAAREKIMHAVRAPGTEAHDLIAALGGAGARECVLVVSDMPLAAWEGFVPQMAVPPVLVDIATYDPKAGKGARR